MDDDCEGDSGRIWKMNYFEKEMSEWELSGFRD